MANKFANGYFFDILTITLTITRAFEKKASVIGSPEYKIMLHYRKDYGDDLTVQYHTSTTEHVGLTYKRMERIICAYPNSEALLARYEQVKKFSEGQRSPYNYVRKWFVGECPNYKELPEFDENGTAVMKATENHAQSDGESAQTTPSSQAEETEQNTGISRLSEGEEVAAQTGAAA